MQIYEEHFDSWQRLYDRYEKFEEGKDHQNHWIFRGSSDDEWRLQTGLERAASQFKINSEDLPHREAGLIRRFKRHYQHYGLQPPMEWDIIEWLSLMQHYGAPTRLLDFTHSFFVALFFALEDLPRSSAIWAVNQTALDEAFRNEHPGLDNAFKGDRRGLRGFRETFARHPPLPFVVSLNPYRVNERLMIQQGTFLCPGDVSRSFEENLAASLGSCPGPALVVKLVLDFDLNATKQSLKLLHRMNMNAATLFPGLDGFSRSLRTLLVFGKEALPPDPELDPTS